MPTKENLVDLILMTMAQGGVIPDRAAVETQVDGYIVGFPHLSDSKDWILSKILEVLVTAVDEAEEMVDPNDYQPWLGGEDRSAWASWPWLKLYLRHKLRRPVSVLDELDRSTDRILDLLGDPKREGLWDRRGLVVGHVQSGKTQHYTALVAKAIDSGYKVVIILSGIHENLRQQTQERIDECISGKNSRDDFSPFGVRSYQDHYRLDDRPDQTVPDITTMTSVAGDFGAAVNRIVDIPLGSVPVVLVIKKNASILRNLLKKLRGPENNLSFQKHPVLVIDDEADHSSVNAAREDEDPKRINEQIRKLLWCCDRVAFVGYTATPYANIFMDDVWVDKTETRKIDEYGSDLFPRAFIISLKAPSNYVGPEVVFGHDGDESVGIPPVSPLPMQIAVEDADGWLPPKHRNGHNVTADLPDSLRKALKCFILSISGRMALGQDASHGSMLVHVTRFNSVQRQVMDQIQAHMESLRELLVGGFDRESVMEQFRSLWYEEYVDKFPSFEAHPSQINDPPALPDWTEVEARINPALARLTYSLVNSLTKEGLDFAGRTEDGLIVVAVGGDRLSRGLTLEGLSASYFLRGARAYDTLMQMGRWFGYRPGYAHLCRVFAPQAIIRNFRMIALATEELRREFGRMCYLHKTPCDYGLRIREPRGDLMVTAINKMRRGETVKIHFAESLISSLDIDENDLDSNYRAFQELVESLVMSLGQPCAVDSKGYEKVGGSNRVWSEVSWDMVEPFFSDYNAGVNACLERTTVAGKSLLHNYIDSVRVHGDLATWTVAIIGSSRGSRAVTGLDEGFRTVNRNRLMDDELRSGEPLHRGRVSFKGVALGGDEGMDLTREQKDEVDGLIAQNNKLSRAMLYRSMRPCTHGLLLIYPIIPTTPKAAKDRGIEDAAFLWGKKDPIIGIAVSLPGSMYDSGCDYVCTKQKLREMFGVLSEDFERDEEEDRDAGVAG
jgi:hypothetical protein